MLLVFVQPFAGSSITNPFTLTGNGSAADTIDSKVYTALLRDVVLRRARQIEELPIPDTLCTTEVLQVLSQRMWALRAVFNHYADSPAASLLNAGATSKRKNDTPRREGMSKAPKGDPYANTGAISLKAFQQFLNNFGLSVDGLDNFGPAPAKEKCWCRAAIGAAFEAAFMYEKSEEYVANPEESLDFILKRLGYTKKSSRKMTAGEQLIAERARFGKRMTTAEMDAEGKVIPNVASTFAIGFAGFVEVMCRCALIRAEEGKYQQDIVQHMTKGQVFTGCMTKTVAGVKVLLHEYPWNIPHSAVSHPRRTQERAQATNMRTSRPVSRTHQNTVGQKSPTQSMRWSPVSSPSVSSPVAGSPRIAGPPPVFDSQQLKITAGRGVVLVSAEGGAESKSPGSPVVGSPQLKITGPPVLGSPQMKLPTKPLPATTISSTKLSTKRIGRSILSDTTDSPRRDTSTPRTMTTTASPMSTDAWDAVDYMGRFIPQPPSWQSSRGRSTRHLSIREKERSKGLTDMVTLREGNIVSDGGDTFGRVGLGSGTDRTETGGGRTNTIRTRGKARTRIVTMQDTFEQALLEQHMVDAHEGKRTAAARSLAKKKQLEEEERQKALENKEAQRVRKVRTAMFVDPRVVQRTRDAASSDDDDDDAEREAARRRTMFSQGRLTRRSGGVRPGVFGKSVLY
jgi:hypothetical protein